MSQSGNFGEESMEEILASIRSSVDSRDPSASLDTSKTANAPTGANAAPPPPSGGNVTPSFGGRRLQDALSQAVAAAPNGGAPLRPVPPIETPKSSKPVVSAAKPILAPSAKLDADDDLADLFEYPTQPSSDSASAPSTQQTTPDTKSAATFGTRAATSANLAAPPVPPPAASDAAVTSTASDIRESELESKQSRTPDIPTPTLSVSGAHTVPLQDRLATSDLPTTNAKSQQADQATPSKEATSDSNATPESPIPKPKREPSFAALATLAAGTPVAPSSPAANATQSDAAPDTASADAAAKSNTSSSVLLPEMRDLPDTNPVAHMHSLAAAMSSSAASNPAQQATVSATQVSATESDNAETDLSEAPTEIVTAPTSGAQPTTATGQDAASAAHDRETSDLNALGSKPDNRSLEAIVVELLKPQLQNWLEANMPRIVERALRAEQDGKKD